jgi:hypothetical protein
MLPEHRNIKQLINQIEKEDLLKNLILQINKDAQLVGIDFNLDECSSPKNIVLELKNLLYNLIKNSFSDYINLLYRIDVSEKQIAEFQYFELEIVVEKSVDLILRKEWQKVWFKSKNQ